jgi:hypothetical protein
MGMRASYPLIEELYGTLGAFHPAVATTPGACTGPGRWENPMRQQRALLDEPMEPSTACTAIPLRTR